MNSLLIGFIVSVPIISVLVILHELGHFLTARFFGVRVKEFGIGFPPRLAGIWSGNRHITVDATTMLPDGYAHATVEQLVGKVVDVRVLDDEHQPKASESAQDLTVIATATTAKHQDKKAEPARHYALQIANRGAFNIAPPEGQSVFSGKVKEVQGNTLVLADLLISINLLPIGGFVRLDGEEGGTSRYSFGTQKAYKRLIILGAGILVNAMIPFVIMPLAFLIPTETPIVNVVVEEIVPQSVAASAGILPDDTIVRIGDTVINTYTALAETISESRGVETIWQINRSGSQINVPITHQGLVGIRLAPPVYSGETVVITRSFSEAVVMGVGTLVGAVTQTSSALYGLTTGERDENINYSPVGPIGIGQLVGEIATADIPLTSRIVTLAGLASLISLSLAILNILPLPALDGGRIFFVMLELLRSGKRVSQRTEGIVHAVGFVLLMVLAFVIASRDITRIIRDDSFFG